MHILLELNDPFHVKDPASYAHSNQAQMHRPTRAFIGWDNSTFPCEILEM